MHHICHSPTPQRSIPTKIQNNLPLPWLGSTLILAAAAQLPAGQAANALQVPQIPPLLGLIALTTTCADVQACVLQAVLFLVPFVNGQGMPPLAAAVVIVYFCIVTPPPQVALQGVGLLQLPMQLTGQGAALQAVLFVVPLANAHCAPPFAAAVVTTNVCVRTPVVPHAVALQAERGVHLPTQSTGQAKALHTVEFVVLLTKGQAVPPFAAAVVMI
jgi:hypothetical protein